MRKDYSYWEKAIGLPSQTPPNSELQNRYDILIVGAGFCGSWLAYFLRRANPKLSIAILERDKFCFGASARNAGFLSSGNISEWLDDFASLGMDGVIATLDARMSGIATVKREFGAEVKIENFGSVDYDAATPEKLKLMTDLNGYLSDKDCGSIYAHREFNFGGQMKPGFFNRLDSQVNPAELLLALQKRLRKMDVHLCTGVVVDKFTDGQAVLGDGQTLQYGLGFICTNAFAKTLNTATVVEPARGQIMVTEPCETATFKSLGYRNAGYDYFRFIGNRLLVGGGRLNFKKNESTDQPEPTSEVRAYLTEFAKTILGHDRFKTAAHWAGIMGLRRGQHASILDLQKPVVIDAKTEEIAGFGGWGVTLTPYLTQLRAAAFK